MAALGIIAVTAARCLVGAVERHDNAAERNTALRSGGTVGFNQPGLGNEEIIRPLPPYHIAGQQIEAIAAGPSGRALRAAAIPDAVDQAPLA